MLNIDEAIAHAREVANRQKGKSSICLQNGLECEHFSDCLKCAEEHEQLAEWLEELKMYRESSYGELYSMVYNKAIDDFVKASRDVVYNYYTEQAYIKYDDFCKIAEQLKKGGNDE